MAWDPALLRKYNSTNHFKLLNQVRNDLKEQPIQRSSRSEARAEARSEARAEARQDAPVRTESSDRRGGRRDGSGRRRSVPAPTPIVSAATPDNSFDPIVLVPVLTDAFTDHH